MRKQTTTTASKFLSYLLRHKPETLDLAMTADGWVHIQELVDKTQGTKTALTAELIFEIVRTCDKQRYGLSDDKLRIRARQGHSISVDVGLDATPPPEVLFHGTCTRVLSVILQDGLKKQQRQHVHMSASYTTAAKTGRRHGQPVVLCVAARELQQSGCDFFLSENGVWLCEYVPPEFVRCLTDEEILTMATACDQTDDAWICKEFDLVVKVTPASEKTTTDREATRQPHQMSAEEYQFVAC